MSHVVFIVKQPLLLCSIWSSLFPSASWYEGKSWSCWRRRCFQHHRSSHPGLPSAKAEQRQTGFSHNFHLTCSFYTHKHFLFICFTNLSQKINSQQLKTPGVTGSSVKLCVRWECQSWHWHRAIYCKGN